MAVSIDTSQVRELSKQLQQLSKRGLPYAVRDSLNAIAFAARKQWAEELKAKFILRNTFTEKSLRVEKATGTSTASIATMQSTVGSVADYMETQESGGTKTSHGKHGVPIPTTTAAGQALRARVRTKQVQRKNWQSAISLPAKVTGSRERRNAVALRMAAKTGGVAFLNLGRRKGLFRVQGGKGDKLRVRMIWDMSRKTVHDKPRPTLEPTLVFINARAPTMQADALVQQIERTLIYKGVKFGPRRR